MRIDTLVSLGRLQHAPIVIQPPDNLQPDRQTSRVRPHGTLAAGCCVRLKG